MRYSAIVQKWEQESICQCRIALIGDVVVSAESSKILTSC